MADRVLVMHEGRIARELSRAEANEESVVRAATGQAEAVAVVSAPTQAAAPAPVQEDAEKSGRQFVDNLIRARELSLVGVLILLVGATTLANPRYLNSQNIRDILLDVSIVALLAVGQTIVVVTRNIDLSVGSVLGITAFLTGVLFADHHVAIPIAFIAGTIVGARLRADQRPDGRRSRACPRW